MGHSGEYEAIERTRGMPATIDSLKRDFALLGVASDMVLFVHSSLSSLGWVCGGAVAVILALEEALGEGGTLVMPTHSTDLTDPADWQNPPVPEEWKAVIRESMPPFDCDLTPTRQMGRISETFRKQKGVLRSQHPHVSFAARGAQARRIVEGHSLDFCLGEGSPLARIYELSGWVLLLGVGHERNTSLHLAEYRMTQPRPTIANGAPLLVDGKRRWVEIRDIRTDDANFMTIGEDFERDTGKVRRGKVAGAQALLFPQRELVDYAREWMEKTR